MQQFAVFVLAVSVLLSASSAAVVPAVAKDASADPEQPAVVQMSMLVPAERIARPSANRLLGFYLVDCGTSDTWVKIHSASVQPNPVKLKGNITISFKLTANHSFGDTQPLATSVLMRKEGVGVWPKLPCVDNVGSCDYPNLCTLFAPPASCPAAFINAGMPCKCPFWAGNFTIPSFTFTVDASKIPKMFSSGNYEASVNIMSGENQVLCVNTGFSLG